MKARIAWRTAPLLAAAFVAACTVSVEAPPDPDPGGEPACTREYAPVCARRGRDRETFSNACEAQAAGYRVVRRGECRRGDRADRPEEPRFCTREYAPVCARLDRQDKTFSNACMARAEGYTIRYQGQCR